MIVFDPTPETAEEEALIEATLGDFVAGCIERSGALLPYLSTVSTARDMDLLREALGEEQISYFGQSYGAALGSVYATLFPSRVRAMVLDGGYDPSAPLADWTVQQIEAEERTLTLVLERCAVDPSCRFHNDGDPFTAFDDLMARLDAEPLSVDDTEVGVGHALEAVYWGLAWEGSWPDLMRALAEAQDGSGRRLLDLAQSFTSSLERLHAIDCLDWPASAWEPSPTEVDAVLAAAPRLGPVQSFGRYPHVCRVWPAEPDPPPPITGAGAGPILVVGTTGDTQAAMESSRELAEHLEQGVLLVFEHTSHTAYWTSPDTLCVVQTVDTYLTGLEPPAHGSRCIYGDTQLHPPG
jgi:pimeloyl-ACP methyl ester carboxylesterase